jgi:hypothetical protein
MTRPTLRKLARALTLMARALEAEARQMPRVLPAAQGTRRTMKLSSQRRAALKLHGRYLELIRMMRPSQKARVKRERARRGPDAAIRLAQKLRRAA